MDKKILMNWNLPDWKIIKKWANENGFEEDLKKLDDPKCRERREGKLSSEYEVIMQRIKTRYLKANKPKEYNSIVQSSKNRSFGLKKEFADLMGGKCELCGYDKHYCALQFHHKNPADKWSSTTYSGYQEDPKRFKKDIKEGKIQLLCSNCHRIIHYNKEKNRRNFEI